MSSMEDLSLIDELTRVDLVEEDHTIYRSAGHEIKIRFRALSHDEAMELAEYSKKEGVTNLMYEQRMLSQALVRPKMSATQVKAWQKSSPAGEIDAVVRSVMALSGMLPDSAKEAYKSVRDESEPGE